jgi:hypothetical protein
MWRDALTTSDIEADFVSFEKLSRLPHGSRSHQSLARGVSRRATPGWEYDLVIVDEAHHARSQATRRHARLKHRRATRKSFCSQPLRSTIVELRCPRSCLYFSARAPGR